MNKKENPVLVRLHNGTLLRADRIESAEVHTFVDEDEGYEAWFERHEVTFTMFSGKEHSLELVPDCESFEDPKANAIFGKGTEEDPYRCLSCTDAFADITAFIRDDFTIANLDDDGIYCELGFEWWSQPLEEEAEEECSA